MEYGIITNPYKNANKDRVYHIGDYNSLEEMNTKALEILIDEDNYRCSKTKAYSYKNTCYQAAVEAIKDGKNRAKSLVKSFTKFRENNTHFLATEYEPDYRVNGQFVDIGRVLNGEPECMVDMFAQLSQSSKYLDIEIFNSHPTFLGSLPDKYAYIFNYYLGFLDLIDQWEQRGVRCKISCVFNGVKFDVKGKNFSTSQDQYKGSVQLKGYSDILDIEMFCRAMFSNNVLILGTVLGYAILGKNPDNATDYVCPDAYISEFVEYDFKNPNLVKIPSLFYPRYILKGAKKSATEILTGLNYPLENF